MRFERKWGCRAENEIEIPFFLRFSLPWTKGTPKQDEIWAWKRLPCRKRDWDSIFSGIFSTLGKRHAQARWDLSINETALKETRLRFHFFWDFLYLEQEAGASKMRFEHKRGCRAENEIEFPFFLRFSQPRKWGSRTRRNCILSSIGLTKTNEKHNF